MVTFFTHAALPRICAFLMIFPSVIFGLQDVKVTTEMDRMATVDQPVKGTITVTHDESLDIDLESFQLDGKPIKVEFLKNVKISSNSPLVLSMYTFSIDPQMSGLHVLPSVSVTVGGEVYHSISSSYEVKDRGAGKHSIRLPSPPTPPPTTTGAIILSFEAIVEGEKILYPGQEITVGYLYTFNYDIDLKKEEVPLIQAKGFRKIGGIERKESTRGGVNYLEVTQKIEALKPGTYTFEPGTIVGRAYRTDRFGKKQLATADSYGQSTPVTLTVLAFPEKDKPPSFHGAIGQSLQLNVSLLTPNKVNVGDKIVLLIEIFGEGQLANLPIPDVCCQPGFSGFFRLSDLPPEEEFFQNIKTFKVEMRPLNDTIKEIPSLAFSYFNPKNQSYTTLKSQPIPLTVAFFKRKSSGQPSREREKLPTQDVGEEEAVSKILAVKAIEIEGNIPLTLSDLKNKRFGTWWVLLIIPFGFAALFFQMHLKAYLDKRRQLVKPKNSDDLFREVFVEKPGSPQFFNLLREAFLLRLVELGEVESVDISLDKLPQTKAANRVHTFLKKIEETRFSEKEGEFEEEFLHTAQKLFKELQS